MLSQFAADERNRLPILLDAAADAVEAWAREGTSKAANRFNAFEMQAPALDEAGPGPGEVGGPADETGVRRTKTGWRRILGATRPSRPMTARVTVDRRGPGATIRPRPEVRSFYRSPAAEAAVHALYDEARASLPFPTEEREVDTALGRTHVLVAGPDDGPDVVALQGGNMVSPLTTAWLAPLAGRVRIWAPDTPGQPGRSQGVRPSGTARLRAVARRPARRPRPGPPGVRRLLGRGRAAA